jgi:hypothetical protein
MPPVSNAKARIRARAIREYGLAQFGRPVFSIFFFLLFFSFSIIFYFTLISLF